MCRTVGDDPPLVLVIGGHDPSGGAGLQADIETLVAHGCRAVSVVTALTTQNTCGVVEIHVQPAAQVEKQCRLVLEESPVTIVKLGLLGSAEIAYAVANLLDAFPNLQAVLDPVLVAGHDGKSLADTALRTAILEQLCQHCILMTPNSPEARILGNHGDLGRCADNLILQGCAAVLITGTHEVNRVVVNRLYGLAGLIQEYQWPRLPGNYHGSGCTLTSAIAARLSLGDSLTTAIERAQDYTWKALKSAHRSGKCQLIPNRFYAN